MTTLKRAKGSRSTHDGWCAKKTVFKVSISPWIHFSHLLPSAEKPCRTENEVNWQICRPFSPQLLSKETSEKVRWLRADDEAKTRRKQQSVKNVNLEKSLLNLDKFNRWLFQHRLPNMCRHKFSIIFRSKTISCVRASGAVVCIRSFRSFVRIWVFHRRLCGCHCMHH